MKKVVLFSLGIIISLPSFAQPGKAEVEKAMQEKYGKEGMAKLEKYLNNISDVELADSYDFPLMLNIKITQYKNGKARKPDMIKYYMDTDNKVIAFRGEDFKSGKSALMVYDTKRSAMAIIDEEKNEVMPVNMNSMMGMGKKMMQMQHENMSVEDVSCNKTSKVKTIHGYKSQQFVCVNEKEGSKAEVWVTDEIPLNLEDIGKGGPWSYSAFKSKADGMSGMFMEGSFYEKGEMVSKMEVIEVDKSADMNVDLNKYKKTSLFGQ